jgi:hypothetical protein
VFIHPVVRAIALHFWLAYDHPFCDGNGRTARALFYWAMLHQGYWLFEFISISSVINKARGQYERSFLLSESDDNDLTYFLLAQVKVIQQAIASLQQRLEGMEGLNHRQLALLRHALRHSGFHYSVLSPPEQPWGEPSDRPQRSAEAGGPWSPDPWQRGKARNLLGTGGSAGTPAGLRGPSVW